MSFKSMTRDQLSALCKQNGIKGYSKLKKDELITKLNEAGVKPADKASDDVKKATKKTKTEKTPEKKPEKPIKEKLDKKIVKSLNPENYKVLLEEFKEAPEQKEVLEMVHSDLSALIDEADWMECRHIVDKYGAIKALLEYIEMHNKSKLLKTSEEEIYKMLLLHLYMNNDKLMESIVKSFVKYYEKLNKPEAPKKVSKAVKKPIRKEESEEDPDEPELEEEDEPEEEPEEDHEDVDDYADSDECDE